MRKMLTFGLAASLTLGAASGVQEKNGARSSRYMGEPAELVTAPNGAIINKEVLDQSPKTAWTGPEIERPVEGVYVLGGYAHRPIVGEEKVRETLTNYMDGISFVLDQSLRHIIGGFGPEGLRHLIKMPDYLAADPLKARTISQGA